MRIEQSPVKLKNVNSAINPSRIPEPLIDVICEVFKEEKDPYSILATYAYIFCGMTINDIRDMFILSDRYGTRMASREYIRQKVVSTFEKINRRYRDIHGHSSIAAVQLERNIEVGALGGVNLKSICGGEEEDIPNDEDIEEKDKKLKIKLKGKAKGKGKAVKTDAGPSGSEGGDNLGDRSWDEELGMVDIEGI